MKFHLNDKMLVTWLLISGLTGFSDAVLLSGIAATIQYYTELFKGSYTNMSTAEISHENINHRFAPYSFKIDSGNPKTSEGYLADQILDNQSSGKVTLVGKIGDYDEQSEDSGSWIIPSELLMKNQSIENPTGNDTVEQFLQKDAEHLDTNETQKYINDYQDLFYKFKDFVNTGINTNINRTDSMNYNHDEKRINVTYVLPIPKTKKYFKISISNLSVTQYNVINYFVMEHMKNKTKAFFKNRENEIVNIDIGDERKQVTSRDLTEIEPQKTPSLNSTSPSSQMPTNPDQAIAYFHNLFNEKDYGDLLEIIKSKHSNISEFKAETTNFKDTKKLPVIKNNGYHAEISTDYIHKKYDVQGNKSLPVNSSVSNNNNFHQFIDQQNLSKEQKDDVNKSITGTATTFLSPIQRNTTKLILQPHSKLPFSYNSSTVRHGLSPQRKKTNLNHFDLKVPSLHTPRPQLVVSVSETQPVETATPSTVLTEKKTVNEVHTPQTANNTDFNVTSSVPTAENITSLMNPSMVTQDWMDISELYKNTVNENVLPSISNRPPSDAGMIDISGPQDTASISVLQAANWILGMKKRLEEEEKNKTERYKDYIKQYLGGESDSVYLGQKEDGSSVMKINKQDNTLEELKNLMMSYFTVMNFTDKKGTAESNSFLEVESIKNATNIFELMEMSSQLAKFNLQMKKQTNSREPSGFVKRVVESQVEKCTRIFNKSLSSKGKQKIPVLLKKNNNRRYMVFTNCMNFKLQKCIKEFSIWLEKGRYYLRQQFQLSRAYENYEIERNLYCLRTYNASSLDSNRHGVRVRPRYKGNRKPPVNRAQGKSKTRIQIRKLRNRDHKVKNGRNTQINKEYNNRQTNIQKRRKKSRVQFKYNSRQQITSRRQNREHKQNKTMQSQSDNTNQD
ncbi:uncharacterized protein LOC124362110 [Homalodisca vitripennis]|uniref:uncharacterized protein LOC124362110 n=1 Tax=Homalodisca vitripennis TaxID=197043 RepID=UPI001EEB3E64|nr:uncharacterized protein LOC124362110 [Homalodisca vitripennis]